MTAKKCNFFLVCSLYRACFVHFVIWFEINVMQKIHLQESLLIFVVCHKYNTLFLKIYCLCCLKTYQMLFFKPILTSFYTTQHCVTIFCLLRAQGVDLIFFQVFNIKTLANQFSKLAEFEDLGRIVSIKSIYAVNNAINAACEGATSHFLLF